MKKLSGGAKEQISTKAGLASKPPGNSPSDPRTEDAGLHHNALLQDKILARRHGLKQLAELVQC